MNPEFEILSPEQEAWLVCPLLVEGFAPTVQPFPTGYLEPVECYYNGSHSYG